MKRSTKKRLVKVANIVCILIVLGMVFIGCVLTIQFFQSNEWNDLMTNVIQPAVIWGTGIFCVLALTGIIAIHWWLNHRKDPPKQQPRRRLS